MRIELLILIKIWTMMDKPDSREIIDRFFKKELSEQELDKLNERIIQDQDFAIEMAEEMTLRESLKKFRRDEIRRILEKRKTSAKKILNRRILYIAVILLVILGTLLIFQFIKKPRLTENERNEAIAELKTDPALFVAGPGWRQLIGSNPDSALLLLENLIAKQKHTCEDIELNYFAGMLLLYYSQEYKRAEIYLSCTLGETAKTSFRPVVPQHLVVAKTLLGKRGEAKDLIEKYKVLADVLPLSILQSLKLDI